MTTLWYAVRQKNTDNYLPSLRPGHRAATGSPLETLSTSPPRLFRKRQHAEQALGWWCLGKTTRSNSYFHDGFEDDCLVTRKVHGRPPRHQMEVVKISLFVQERSTQQELL